MGVEKFRGSPYGIDEDTATTAESEITSGAGVVPPFSTPKHQRSSSESGSNSEIEEVSDDSDEDEEADAAAAMYASAVASVGSRASQYSKHKGELALDV